MAEFVPLWSIAGQSGDIRGEIALQYLPERSSPTDSVLVSCGAVRAVDACSFAVLRTLLEYPATRLLIPVTLALPTDDEARRMLAAGLGSLPNGVQLARDTQIADEPHADVILPATRVGSIALAELIASHLPDASHTGGLERRELSFLAAALQELLANVLLHANSPVDAIGAIALDAEQNEVQVAVCDLGNSISYDPKSAERLEVAWNAHWARGRKTPSGLAGIVASAERRGFDLSLSIYAGTGRLFARSGGSQAIRSEEPHIPGFTAVATLHR